MSNYSRTRTALKTVISSIKSLLSAYTGWSVGEFAYSSHEDMFDFLDSIQPPCCVLSYIDSKTSDSPAVTHYFSIIIVTVDMGDFNSALDSAQDLVDEVYDRLDYQILQDSTMLINVVGQKPIQFKNHAGLVGYIVNVQAEDR